jgi:hypothetical protein
LVTIVIILVSKKLEELLGVISRLSIPVRSEHKKHNGFLRQVIEARERVFVCTGDEGS